MIDFRHVRDGGSLAMHYVKLGSHYVVFGPQNGAKLYLQPN